GHCRARRTDRVQENPVPTESQDRRDGRTGRRSVPRLTPRRRGAPAGTRVRMKNRPDLLTLASLAVVAYALANVIHEGLGHAGTCVLVGGKPLVLTSMHFEGDTEGLSPIADRLIAAGGTIANLVAAALVLPFLRSSRER